MAGRALVPLNKQVIPLLNGRYELLLLQHWKLVQTSSVNLENLPCQNVRKKAPKCCIPQLPNWGPPECKCNKICLPCCRIAPEPPECNTLVVVQSSCKKLEYRIPSFSECKKAALLKIRPKECCYYTPYCERDRVGREGRKPFITAAERIDRILGRAPPRRFSTLVFSFSPYAFTSKRLFSTSQPMRASPEEEALCPKSKDPPCLKGVEIPGAKHPHKPNTAGCPRVCMPCCGFARDPPDCAIPFTKPPCSKLKCPRPSYTECIKMMVKPFVPCECPIKRPPPCEVPPPRKPGRC